MTDSSNTFEDVLDDIFDAIECQDRDGAIKLGLEAHQKGVDHPLVLLLAAEGMEADGRGEEALAILRRVTADSPEEAEAWRRLGSVLTGLGRPVEALAAFETALSINPGIYWTLMAAGSVSAGLNDLAAARGFFQRAAKLEPQRPEPRAALAMIDRPAAAERKPQPQSWGYGFKVTQGGRLN